MTRRPLVLIPITAAALLLAACTPSSAPEPAAEPAAEGSTPSPDAPSGDGEDSGDATSASDDPFTPVIARVLSTPRPVPATDGLVHIA